MPKKSNQSSDSANTRGVNAGVGGDLRSPYMDYPKGEPQHDDQNHFTGIGNDVFTPLLPTGKQNLR